MARLTGVLAVALLSACAKPAPPPEVSLAESLTRLDAAIRETILDEARANAVLAVTAQVYELALASATREQRWATTLREANRSYDTTPDELEALMARWREERRQDVERLIALRLRLATLLDANQWDRLARHRLASIQAYLEVGRAARAKRAVEGSAR